MRIGIMTPVVVQVPGVASPWEATASMADIARIGTVADQLGFHHLVCSEHVAVPTAVAAQRGGTYWDPLATFGHLSAVTERIRFATHVLVLGYHHPLAIAKRYGTLDVVSGGRLILGLGVGSLEEEFALLKAPFADRGARADDAMRALRASLSRTQPEYHGEFYDFAGFQVVPSAVQERVPLWVGGHSGRSLRRAVELGDGWAPFGLGAKEIRQMLDRTPGADRLDVVLPTGPLDPAGDPFHSQEVMKRLAASGASVLNVTLRAESAMHYCEQLHALAQMSALQERTSSR